MNIAHCDPADQRRTFDNFRITIIADIRNRFRFQPLLSGPNLTTQKVLAEIRDTPSAISMSSMSQLGF